MKKHLALAIGFIVCSAMLLIPFAGAFADSDPGLSTVVFNSAFGWYTGFPMVDTYGYLDLNDWTITYQSNGTTSSNPSSGDVVYLYQPGDFVEISFNNWDLLSSYTTPIWCLQFGQNPAYSGNLQDAKYTLYQSYNSSDCFYKYVRTFSYDNREIKWAHCFFSYPGGGITKIRVEYDGTPVIWNAIYIKFLGFRNEPNGSSYTQADLMQLEATIANTLSIAQLAEIIQLDSSDVDLSTLEATTVSILQKLADVPDIIQYIDQIETIDNNILNAITDFYSYYNSLFDDVLLNTNVNYQIYELNTFTEVTQNGTSLNDGFYMVFPYQSWFKNNYIKLQFMTRFAIPTRIEYAFANNFPLTGNALTQLQNSFQDAYFTYSSLDSNYQHIVWIYIPPSYFYNDYKLIIRVTYNGNNTVFITNNYNYHYFGYKSYKSSWYNRIEMYLQQLLGLNNSVPSSIDTVTDTVSEQIDDITQFEDNYNQSLESSATQIDVSSYEIPQTQGMSFMRTYTELNFDRMQNFRILFLTPLILALAAFFLRRKT